MQFVLLKIIIRLAGQMHLAAIGAKLPQRPGMTPRARNA